MSHFKVKRDFFMLKNLIFPAAVFAVLILLLNKGLGQLDKTTQQEQLDATRRAVITATVQCYALEGQYPPTLDYLSTHYGLSVDQERYIIHYDVFASNIMPDVIVLPRDF